MRTPPAPCPPPTPVPPLLDAIRRRRAARPRRSSAPRRRSHRAAPYSGPVTGSTTPAHAATAPPPGRRDPFVRRHARAAERGDRRRARLRDERGRLEAVVLGQDGGRAAR